MKHFRTALLVGLIVPSTLMLMGCGNNAKSRSGPNAAVKNAKYICNDLKTTFEGGETIKDYSGGTGNARPDSRMGILVLQINGKISLDDSPQGRRRGQAG